MNRIVCLSCTSLLLVGCQTVPTAPKILEACPRIPALELDMPMGALEHNFFDRMQNFLSGKLPSPPDYSLHSKPVSQTGLRLNAN
jgi:hypothetical protein